MTPVNTLTRPALILALTLCATSAGAFEFRLETVGDDDLRAQIKSASSLASAEETGIDAPDEIIAAVQADYRAILGALYREGYYGPDISIRVDGREGSSISLVSLPKTVNIVSVRVDPGARFTFGRAEVGPLAEGTELPEEFATGKTAPGAACWCGSRCGNRRLAGDVPCQGRNGHAVGGCRSPAKPP